jgi:shikimate kinase
MLVEVKNLKKPIVLVGIMGAGKSSVGQKLAKSLYLPFYDIDNEIEKVACCSVADIFFYAGEEYFRKVERQVLESLLTKGQPMIIATGGGAFINDNLRELIKKYSISVWLKADLEILVERVNKRPYSRPLLDGKDTRKIMDELIKKRYPIYSEADITLVSDNQSIGQMITSVVESINQHVS